MKLLVFDSTMSFSEDLFNPFVPLLGPTGTGEGLDGFVKSLELGVVAQDYPPEEDSLVREAITKKTFLLDIVQKWPWHASPHPVLNTRQVTLVCEGVKQHNFNSFGMGFNP